MNARLETSNGRRTDSAATAPLRAVHFISSLGVYGAERWTLALLRNLDPAEVQASVVTIGTRAGARMFHELLSREGFDCLHLAVQGRFSARGVHALRRLLRERGVHLLHTHGFKSDVLGALAAAGTGVRLVSTPHGWSADESWRIRAYERIGRAFLRRFDAIFPLSPALHADFVRWRFPDQRLRLVLNGVDLSPFAALDREPRPRTRGDPLRVLFAGRLCAPKGVADLLHALARYRNVCTEGAMLRIAGDGDQRAALVALADQLGVSQHVRFLGTVPSVVTHLQWADVLVLPSLSEGIPRTVMEAFAAGVPVIGTEIPGIRVLVEHMITGLLVPVHDPDAIARALQTIAHRPHLAAALATSARQRVERDFSAGRMAAEYTRHYRDLCGAVDA